MLAVAAPAAGGTAAGGSVFGEIAGGAVDVPAVDGELVPLVPVFAGGVPDEHEIAEIVRPTTRKQLAKNLASRVSLPLLEPVFDRVRPKLTVMGCSDMGRPFHQFGEVSVMAGIARFGNPLHPSCVLPETSFYLDPSTCRIFAACMVPASGPESNSTVNCTPPDDWFCGTRTEAAQNVPQAKPD